MLLYMCPHTLVSSYYICVLILLVLLYKWERERERERLLLGTKKQDASVIVPV